jgi:threonylcarbamoyladenosine tRNA methylthiotransferase MtaB
MEIDQELIDMMASEDWLCRHFHIPLQSGDDRVLRMMNRYYTSKEFKALISSIKSKIPLAAIGVDVMAGFPGEDEISYGNSYSLIKDLPVSYLHVFPFSARAGTAAAGFNNQVNQKVIKKRAEELRTLGMEKRKTFYNSCLANEFSALTEGWYSKEEKMIKGLTDNYLPVIFSSDSLLENRMAEVRALKQDKEVLICEPV